MKNSHTGRRFLLLLAAAALLIPALAWAQPTPPAAPGAPDGPGQWMHREGRMHPEECGPQARFEKLGLSEEQQSRFQELRLQFQKEQVMARGEIEAAEARLQALLLDPEADRGAVMKAGEAVSKLRQEMQMKRLEHRMDVRALLTPEQRTKLVQWKAMHGRRGPEERWGRQGCRHHGDGPRGMGAMHRRGGGPRPQGPRI